MMLCFICQQPLSPFYGQPFCSRCALRPSSELSITPYTCIICFEELSLSEARGCCAKQCNMLGHSSCLDAWYTSISQFSCPQCRGRKVNPDQDEINSIISRTTNPEYEDETDLDSDNDDIIIDVNATDVALAQNPRNAYVLAPRDTPIIPRRFVNVRTYRNNQLIDVERSQARRLVNPIATLALAPIGSQVIPGRYITRRQYEELYPR